MTISDSANSAVLLTWAHQIVYICVQVLPYRTAQALFKVGFWETGTLPLLSYIPTYTYTNRFRLLPSRWCRRFSPWQPSVLCQWPSLVWCHRCACHFSVCQAILSLDVLWVVFPSQSYSTCFLLCGFLPFASHAHTMIVVFGSGPIW